MWRERGDSIGAVYLKRFGSCSVAVLVHGIDREASEASMRATELERIACALFRLNFRSDFVRFLAIGIALNHALKPTIQ
jgi:hypothetical protein